MSDRYGEGLFLLAVGWIAAVFWLVGGGLAITYCRFGFGFVTTCSDATLAANSASAFAAVAAWFTVWRFIAEGFNE